MFLADDYDDDTDLFGSFDRTTPICSFKCQVVIVQLFGIHPVKVFRHHWRHFDVKFVPGTGGTHAEQAIGIPLLDFQVYKAILTLVRISNGDYSVDYAVWAYFNLAFRKAIKIYVKAL